jgi:ATP-dependent RNA helicase RhlE
MSFTTLGLSDALVQGILATGYTEPTEIQLQTIPLAVQGNDVIGLAQTGTGKTAAFVLPMLNKLDQSPAPNPRHVRALVLTPTRELATQVESSIKKYGRFMKLFSATIYGGTDMYHQIVMLRKGFDILIATPGRLIDHLRRNTVNLSQVEMLVLDEADRMLDMGFVHDVKKIIAALPQDRQTLLFSATMSGGIKTLTSSVQRSPKLVQIGEERKPADSVSQKFYSVSQDQKSALLFHILDTVDMDSVLVFSRTKHGADKIQHRLEQRGITSVAIHSNRTQSQREKALKGFRQKHFKVLVATDIAARGIDIEGISHVINYDTPNFAEDYVHRIGRTGRAAATGDAITFVARDEYKHFRRIAEFIGKRFELNRYPDFEYADTADLVKEEGISRHRPERDFRRERSSQKPARRQPSERRSEREDALKSSGFGNKKSSDASGDAKRPHKPKSSGGFKRPKFASKSKDGSAEYAPRDKKSDWQSLLSDEEAYNKVQRKAGQKE